mgnify:CR=1 FL=1
MDSLNCSYYLGSGVFIKKALKKYGRENFKKKIYQTHLENYNNLK